MLFLEISYRYFRNKKNRRGISFISFVSLGGITLGVIALTIVISVMNGFDRELKKRILGVTPHLVVTETSSLSTNQLAMIEELNQFDAAGRFLELKAMIVHSQYNELVNIYGIDPDEEERLSILNHHMIRGDLSLLDSDENLVILGRPLLKRLGLAPGDRATLVVPRTGKSGKTVKPVINSVIVAGVYELGSELDYRLLFMNVDNLARMADSTIGTRIRLHDIFYADSLAKALKNQGVSGVYTWNEEFGDFFRTVKMEKIMMFILMSVIIAIAAFNIVSSLSIMVADKRGDIAILRTLGASRMDVMSIFVFQGAIIGMLGLVMGLVIGLPLAYNIGQVVGFFEDLLGARMLAGTYFDRVPSDVRFPDIMIICTFCLTISLLATIRPAFKASGLQPAEVLKSE